MAEPAAKPSMRGTFVILLIVIFARVVVEAVDRLRVGFDWSHLVLPLAIVPVAGAIRLRPLGSQAEHNGPAPSKPDAQ